MSNELGLHRQDGNSRDPLSTIDGHCSPRTMVLRWIEQQDKTSITRDLFNVVDLYDEDTLNSFDRSDRSDSTTSSLQHSELSVTALPIIPSDKFFFENPSRTERWFDRCGSLKTSGSVKQIWVIVLVIICILSPIIIGSSILVFVIRLTSIFPSEFVYFVHDDTMLTPWNWSMSFSSDIRGIADECDLFSEYLSSAQSMYVFTNLSSHFSEWSFIIQLYVLLQSLQSNGKSSDVDLRLASWSILLVCRWHFSERTVLE